MVEPRQCSQSNARLHSKGSCIVTFDCIHAKAELDRSAML